MAWLLCFALDGSCKLRWWNGSRMRSSLCCSVVARRSKDQGCPALLVQQRPQLAAHVCVCLFFHAVLVLGHTAAILRWSPAISLQQGGASGTVDLATQFIKYSVLSFDFPVLLDESDHAMLHRLMRVHCV